jgi:hypothetical protein
MSAKDSKACAAQMGAISTDFGYLTNTGRGSNRTSVSCFRESFDCVSQPFDSLVVQVSIEGLRRATGHGFDVGPHGLLGRWDVREQYAFLPIPDDADPFIASAVLDVHASERVVVEVFDGKREPETFQRWTEFCEGALMEERHVDLFHYPAISTQGLAAGALLASIASCRRPVGVLAQATRGTPRNNTDMVHAIHVRRSNTMLPGLAGVTVRPGQILYRCPGTSLTRGDGYLLAAKGRRGRQLAQVGD